MERLSFSTSQGFGFAACRSTADPLVLLEIDGAMLKAIRQRLYRVIFEHDTPAGRAFDIALLVAILLSVTVVMLDSVAGISQRYGPQLRAIEWFFTILFTVEYVLRLF